MSSSDYSDLEQDALAKLTHARLSDMDIERLNQILDLIREVRVLRVINKKHLDDSLKVNDFEAGCG